MIKRETFSEEHIHFLHAQSKRDPILLERTVYAFGLLEALARVGMPFVFKGGTCLMLLLDKPQRLSTDIDIIVEPGTDLDEYLEKASKVFPFHCVDEQVRVGKNDIVKRHFKFLYNSPVSQKEFYILLDVLFEHQQYASLVRREIRNELLLTEPEYLSVLIPDENSILADKMTAFAPNTIGIPYFKKDRECNMEIIKQLYDINRLFENVDDFGPAYESFLKVSNVELGYRGLEGRLNEYFEDVRQTAICIATRGQAGNGDINFFMSGIKRVKSFMYQEKYQIEEAIKDASRAAYLATCFEKGVLAIEKYPKDNPEVVLSMEISDVLPTKLRKLRNVIPEAYYYWAKVDELLKS